MPADSQASPRSALPASAERIVESARRLFVAGGLRAVTTDRLCSEANVSKTTLYKYFGDMSGLFVEVVRREGDQFLMEEDLVSETPEQFRGSVIAGGATTSRVACSVRERPGATSRSLRTPTCRRTTCSACGRGWRRSGPAWAANRAPTPTAWRGPGPAWRPSSRPTRLPRGPVAWSSDPGGAPSRRSP